MHPTLRLGREATDRFDRHVHRRERPVPGGIGGETLSPAGFALTMLERALAIHFAIA
jgi:hypothetical protein